MLAIYFIGLVSTFILVGVYNIIDFSINDLMTEDEKKSSFLLNIVTPMVWPAFLLFILLYIPSKCISNWAKDHKDWIREKDKYGLFN